VADQAAIGADRIALGYRAFGGIGVAVGDEPVSVGGPTQRRLLAVLLVHRNSVVSVDRLCDILFAGEPTDAAPTTLRSYVARLRRVVDRPGSATRLVTQPPGYRLDVVDDAFDVAAFEHAVATARQCVTRGDPAGASQALREGLAQWRGDPYAEFAYEDWARPEVQRLAELRLVAHELLADVDLACGRAAEVASELEGLAAEQPLRESFQARLMVALYRSGRQADALRVYQDHRRALAEDLGLEPSPELADLERRILTHDETLGEAQPGELPLRGYRLGERLGTGRHGTVHAARLPGVDRDIAIRIVPEALANNPGFVRSFDADARRLAAVRHEAVVPVYDWWREPGAAYLVMRRLRGGTLRDQLQRGPLPAADVAALATRVGGALAAAAQAGVAHGRVVAESVLFDEAGDAYLGDFPVGSGDATDTADDVGDLVALVAESLSGRRPAAGDVGELPPALAPALSTILSAAEPPPLPHVVSMVVEALSGEAIEPAPVVERPNPYKGLRAFDEPDADDFFGRDDLVDEILQRLAAGGQRGRLVLVVGGSGSGKSSLVRAGLLPRVRSASGASDGWFVAAMVPGASPFKELAESLRRVAVVEAEGLEAELAAGERGIAGAVRRIVPPGGELLLVLDQFEELFTLADDATQRAFLDGLTTALSEPDTPLRVVATLRADFYDRPLRFDRFGALVGEASVPIAAMSAAELEAAIVGPAERVGGSIELALVAELVGAVLHEPAALPSLQFTLYELAERSPERVIRLAAYRELGGVDAAIAARAEALYLALDDRARTGLRRLFERLVVVNPEAEPTRRRALRSELEHAARGSAAVPGQEVLDVIEAWAQARLLTLDRHPQSREPTVEVAHEALLRDWPRLRSWLEEDREAIVALGQLREAADGWDGLDRDAGALYRGARLDTALHLVDGQARALAPLEREFLDASRTERDRERQREVDQLQRTARANRRLRAQLAALGVALVVALVVGVVAIGQRNRASEERGVATARELAAAANANLDVDPERSVLLALAAVDRAQSGTDAALPEAEQALHDAVTSSRIERRVTGLGGAVAWSPDGTMFAAADAKGSVAIFDAATGEQVQVIAGHDERVNGIAFSPDGTLLGTTGDDGFAKVWDLATGRELHALESDSPAPRDAVAPSFSPDGSLFAAGWWVTEHPIRLLDLATGAVVQEISTVQSPVSTSFDPSGTRMVIADRGGATFVVDVGSGAEVLTVQESDSADATWSPDGASIAIAGEKGTARVVDAATGEQRFALLGHRDRLTDVAWSPDSTRLVTASDDGTAKVWRIANGGGQELFALSARDTQSGVGAVAFSPDGSRVVTGDGENTAAIVWDVSITGDAEVANLPATASGEAVAATFTPDGRYLLTPNAAGAVTVWDAEAFTNTRPLDSPAESLSEAPPSEVGTGREVTGLAMSPDGRLAAVATVDQGDPPVGSVQAWDFVTGQEAFRLDFHGNVDDLAWSRDGDHLAISMTELVLDSDGQQIPFGNVTIVDRSGRRVALLPDEEGMIQSKEIAFTHDGERLLASRSPMLIFDTFFGQVAVWDWRGERVERTFDMDGNRAVLSPTGDIVVSTLDEFHLQSQRIEVLDWASGRHLRTLAGHSGSVTSAAFSPDGTRLATAGTDGTVRLWDPRTGEQQLVLRGHADRVGSVAFSPDGTQLVSMSADGTARVWSLDLDELIDEAEAGLTRGLTDDECRQYLHVDRCPST